MVFWIQALPHLPHWYGFLELAEASIILFVLTLGYIMQCHGRRGRHRLSLLFNLRCHALRFSLLLSGVSL